MQTLFFALHSVTATKQTQHANGFPHASEFEFENTSTKWCKNEESRDRFLFAWQQFYLSEKRQPSVRWKQDQRWPADSLHSMQEGSAVLTPSSTSIEQVQPAIKKRHKFNWMGAERMSQIILLCRHKTKTMSPKQQTEQVAWKQQFEKLTKGQRLIPAHKENAQRREKRWKLL